MDSVLVELKRRCALVENLVLAAEESPDLHMQGTFKDAAVVLLHGHWENFLRELMRAFIEDLKSKGLGYSSLPGCIRDTHRTRTSELLYKHMQFFEDITVEDVAAGFHKSLCNNDSSGVVAQAFCITESSADQKVVSKLFNQIGCPDVWLQITEAIFGEKLDEVINAGKGDARFKRKQRVKTINGQREVILAKLTRLVAARNQVAHQGLSTSLTPDFPTIRSWISLIEQLGGACISISKRRLTEIVSVTA
ncbi:hypothetical protein D3C86_1240060 [compost metagenome]